jgi:starch synthase
MEKLKILIASSEVAPFAKTGGLADVCGSLPLALEELGVDVRVIMPKYATVKVQGDETTIGKNIKVYFVKNDYYFKRQELYGDKFGDYSDNLDRFAYFCREVLERCKHEGFEPNIIHCNDWHTALIPVYLNTMYRDDPFFLGTRSMLTIHNLAYQGLFPKEEYPKIGLGWEMFNIDNFEFYDKVNLMKAGIVYADAVSTVSPSYSKEILTKEFGCGLEGVLANRAEDLHGVLNGIDEVVWDPMIDKKIYKNYSLQTLAENLEDRFANKDALQKELKLKPDRSLPMIAMVSRLADQKGADLVAEIIDNLLNMKLQFVLLGTGDNKYHIIFDRIAKKYVFNTSINLRFDATLADKIYAACDMFLIPSRYEPCGLGQMIALRYGSIPVVRQTGGLKDTVKEYDAATGEGNGFTFVEYRSKELLGSVKRAVALYQDKDAWANLVRKAMSQDFSWKNSGAEYIKLYRAIIGKE